MGSLLQSYYRLLGLAEGVLTLTHTAWAKYSLFQRDLDLLGVAGERT